MSLSTDLVRLCDRPATPQDYERAAWHLLDWLGIVFATRGSEAEQKFGAAGGVSKGALAAFERAESAPEVAAFALGSLGSLLEMDDLHRRSILHAGDVVCPAGLVAGLAAQTSGPELLKALLAGYEVALRIGNAAAAGGYAAWYNSATCGVFGAAMAASAVQRLAPRAQAFALGHAGMQASGLWQCRLEPGYAKQVATAHAARAGITAACAAGSGLAAPLEILEGDLGFFATLYPAAHADAVMRTGSEAWCLHDVSLKPWSACRHTHPAIAAALELRAAGVDPDTAQAITVSTYQAALDFCDLQQPRTAHDARFSLQHCVAVALRRGAPKRQDFEDPARRDCADLVELRGRITLLSDPRKTALFPEAYSAELTLTDSSGHARSASADHAPGDPEAPLTDTQIIAKFMENCHDGGLPEATAVRLCEAVRALPKARDLDTLKHALAMTSAEGDKRD